MGYDENVFINCPFDGEYQSLFQALVFSVQVCGFVPRSALELEDGSEVRIGKIVRIIAESRYGIHDLSRTGLDPESHLPRFNMPLELGLFLGAKYYGVEVHEGKPPSSSTWSGTATRYSAATSRGRTSAPTTEARGS